MDIGSELLSAYMEVIITTGAVEWPKDGFKPRMQACMLLDKVAGDLMDKATPKQIPEIFAVSTAIKNRVLDVGQ